MLRITDESRKWWILIAMGAVAGLIMLDETVVGVALPTVRRDLGMSEVASHWVISAYMLVFAGAAAAGGKMGDIIGFKKLLIVGVAIFGFASLASGFATDGAFLIAARAIQGVGAAVIFPSTVAMIMIVFPKEQRGMAMGVLAAIGTTFLAAGPLVGGFLTEIVSWRWIFWINVPIVMLIALIVLTLWVDPPRKSTRPSFDFGGLVTLVAGLGMLIFAIMQGAAWGWTQSIILALLAGGIIVLALFTVIERRRDAPLIEVDLFRVASFGACNFVLFVGQFSKITIVVFGALYLQDALAMSPLETGLALLVSVVAFPVMSAPVGRVADKFGSRLPVVGGMVVATSAMFWLGLAAAWDSYIALVPGLVLWGVGMVFCYAPTLRAMANVVPVEKQGQTSGIGVTARLLGGAVGMAVGSTLLVMTGFFQVVFLATAGIMGAALALAYFTIERSGQDQAL
ncbi:MAG: MFS transporter [Alphaproteobacteria bacterium]|nr:MFS transporter [Alphaproteobacteria bacterium]